MPKKTPHKIMDAIMDAISELTIDEVVEIQDHCDELIQADADEEDDGENYEEDDE